MGYDFNMPHIHTKPGQHDFTASAFIFRLDGDEPEVYLHTHKRLGKFLHFGGHVELDENPWQTIAREIKEESGYEISQLQLLQPKDRIRNLSSGTLIPYPIAVISVGYYGDEDTNHYHDDVCFAFVTTEKPKNQSGDGESKDLRLFKRDQLAKLSDEEIVPALREMGLFVFDHCLDKWEKVSTRNI